MPQIEYNLDFKKGCGGEMPRGPGIYAEIHWPTMSLRIGESKNVQPDVAIRWFQIAANSTGFGSWV